jgi:hypothetical protein
VRCGTAAHHDRALKNGIADLAGMSCEVLRAFSRRRQEIEMHMEERGESGARAAQRAAYAARTTTGIGTAACA